MKDVPQEFCLEKIRCYLNRIGHLNCLRRNGHDIHIDFESSSCRNQAVGNHLIDDLGVVAIEFCGDLEKDGPNSCQVHGLTESISQWDLVEYFTTFGKVKYVYRPLTDISSAIVSFRDEISAELALARQLHRLKGVCFRVEGRKRRSHISSLDILREKSMLVGGRQL